MKRLQTLQSENFSWHNVDTPTPQLMKKLEKEFNFHHLSIEDSLAHNQRPKIDEYENYLFIVLHIPKQIGDDLVMDEIDMFIGQNFVITVHEGSPFVNNLFRECTHFVEKRTDFTEKGSAYFLYKFINEIFSNMHQIVEAELDLADRLEEHMFEKPGQRDMLNAILSLRKDIITLRRIVHPQRTVIPQLEHKTSKFLPENLEAYFEDTVDKIERIWNQVETLSALSHSLERTNESLISHNINNIIKVLTIFSVMILPITFITGLYGMNLGYLPLASNPHSFLIIGGVMLSVVALMLAFFKYKKWL